MNILEGTIDTIKIKNSLSLVTLKLKETTFSAIVIDTPDTAAYLEVGNAVHLVFKETEVVLGKDLDHPISLQNRLKGTISAITAGELLSKVAIDTTEGPVHSVVTTKAVAQLGLEEGSEVMAMIKTNEIMLSAS